MSRLVVVSNRTADPRNAAAGGLAVAVRETLQQTGGLWFGWSGNVAEEGDGGTPRTSVTFRRNGAGLFRRNDATGNERFEGSNGDQGCLILPPFASSVLGVSTPGFSPR